MCYNTSKKRKWLKMRRQFSRKMQFRCILSCKFNRNWDSQVFDRQNPAPFKKFRKGNLRLVLTQNVSLGWTEIVPRQDERDSNCPVQTSFCTLASSTLALQD